VINGCSAAENSQTTHVYGCFDLLGYLL